MVNLKPKADSGWSNVSSTCSSILFLSMTQEIISEFKKKYTRQRGNTLTCPTEAFDELARQITDQEPDDPSPITRLANFEPLTTENIIGSGAFATVYKVCLLYTSPSPRDLSTSRMPSSA